MRSFDIRNISFENLTQTDLFARGWHKSGYIFGIEGADTDGWVDRHLALDFPATSKFTEAVIQVVRFPSKADMPLAVAQEGRPGETRVLLLEQTETITVPLSQVQDTKLVLSAGASFPLAAPDSRTRSYRVVNIDFR
jgi:hypothetical protein